MEPVVLFAQHGHKTAFKITTAKVFTLTEFMNREDQGYGTAYVAFLNSDQKARALTANLIRKEFPEFVGSPYYRRINYE